MKIFKREESDDPQPAIDTPCDSCGAIYDLVDCNTCTCGMTFCPDCHCENLQFRSLAPVIKKFRVVR